MIDYSGCKPSRGEILILRGYNEARVEVMFTLGDDQSFHACIGNALSFRPTSSYIFGGRKLFDDMSVISGEATSLTFSKEAVILNPYRRCLYVDSAFAACNFETCRGSNCCLLRNIQVSSHAIICCDGADLSHILYHVFFGNSVVDYERKTRFLSAMIAYANVLLYSEFYQYISIIPEFNRECYLCDIPHCPTIARLILRLNVNEVHEMHLRSSLEVMGISTELANFVTECLDEPKIIFLDDFETEVLRLCKSRGKKLH
jgi:hypothetical protein